MSVSLSIDWSDGKSEHIPISSQRGGKEWARIGTSLGLQLVPLFHQFMPVEPAYLDELIREVGIFRAAIILAYPNADDTISTIDRLLDAFQRLKSSTGWEASIG
jgi:hypothetical protein